MPVAVEEAGCGFHPSVTSSAHVGSSYPTSLLASKLATVLHGLLPSPASPDYAPSSQSLPSPTPGLFHICAADLASFCF